MKTKISILLASVLLMVTSFVYTANAQESVRKTVLIMPLDNNVDIGIYSEGTSDNIREIVSKSLHSFISTLPFVKSPNFAETRAIDWDPANINSIASRFSADYVIYGDLQFSGMATDPVAEIKIIVWSKESTNVFTGYYKTRIDLSLLDTIDDMLIEVIQKTFNIVSRLSVVNFKNFRIGNERYQIFANNQLIAVASNSTFGLETKILAETPYNYQIIRERDNVLVYNHTVTLAPGYSTNISYTGTASVVIGKISHAIRNKTYQVLLNGRRVEIGSVVSNLNVNMEHGLILLDQNSVILDKQNFTLIDGETRRINPTEPNHPRALFFRAYIGQRSMIGIGVDLFFVKRFWAGLNIGYSFYHRSTDNVNINVNYFTLDIGWAFASIEEAQMKFSVGWNGGVYQAYGNLDQITGGYDSTGSWTSALFLQFDWKFLYVKLEFGGDFGAQEGFFFGPAIGFRF